MSTKQLARELGLLRQRSKSSNGSKKSISIEFPAVLLNTSTGEIQSEFHSYVQPQERPILSEFCTELTGITQAQVEAGIPLPICLSRFSRWLQKLQLERGVVFSNRPQRSPAPSPSQKLCAFVTWSDWDLGVCLQFECKRKQLHKPDVLNSWIDLRSTYRLFYDRKPKGLNGALQDLGIQFSGREHSGLDDSRNTAQLAARMMRDGCVMKITRSLEKLPFRVTPMFENKKPDKVKEDNTSTTNKIPPESCPIKSRSEKTSRDLDPKRNSTPAPTSRSLISPKTLLNGTTTPLWGTSVKAAAVANISTPVMMNRPSPRGNINRSLLLCSTTLGCVSKPPAPDQRLVTVATGEEGLSVEPEERWGSYDDVVLEADDEDVAGGTERQFEVDYREDLENEAHSSADEVTRHDVSGEDNFETPKSAVGPSASICFDSIRQHSTIPEPSTFFVEPEAVSRHSNQHKTGLVFYRRIQEKRDGPHRIPEANTPALPRHLIPRKTSTPYASFARPKALATNPRDTPKSSFAIFSEPAKPSSAGSQCASTKLLSSLSTNVISAVCGTAKGGRRITSPLCVCGRRAKRQVVCNGGPNQGRGFYCCPVRRSGGGAAGGRIQKGCEFFKWESALMKSGSAAAPRTSVSLCAMTPTLGRPPQRSALRKSC
ncbi:ERI1 exoribonuclease 2 isoform 2-T2 [Spinachia spinachia]